MEKKVGLILFLIFLINIQTVKSLGVTQISPVDSNFKSDTADLKLKRGDTVRFYFQIQAVTSTNRQVCISSIAGLDPLVVSLDENETTLEAGEIRNVYGSIFAPKNAPIKKYIGTLVVDCAPQIESAGSVISQTMGINVNIEVVKGEMNKEEKVMNVSYSWMIVPLVLIISIICVFLWFKRKKDEKMTYSDFSHTQPLGNIKN